MKHSFRELMVLVLAGVSVGAFFRYRENPSSARVDNPDLGPQRELVVWRSDKHTGQTWANLGARGKITFPPDSGINGKGKALTIRMSANGYRGCGLNWKGWFPADAGDDASPFTALSFFIRQVTRVEKIDISVALVDNVQRPKGETASNSLYVVGDGGTPKIDGEWRRIVLPLAKFTQNKPLKLDRLWEIDFANIGAEDVVIQIDRIGFTTEAPAGSGFPPRPGYGASAKLDFSASTYPISDGIYGVCSLPRDKLQHYGIAVTRWGGNSSSRYNWKINADNGAHDWYFKNRGTPIRDLNDNGYLKHIKTAQSIGATTYQTIPMLGWVAKDHGSYGFSVRKHGPQKGTEPGHDDIGNGFDIHGKPIRCNDPHETSMQVGPDFIAEAVALLKDKAGAASKAGTKYWALDNEPMLWHETHRDVCSIPLGYDELWDRTIQYAEAIKKADPTAKVAGFCSWGWTDLFYSAQDEGGDRYRSLPDYKAHGNEPLAEWFIRKCAEYKKTHGTALIDVFDFHWYPQAQVRGQTPYLGKGVDQDLNELRLRSTRDLWDPDYKQESWIAGTGDRKPTEVIHRVRHWIEKHNPGMELCVGEYNFGGGDNISGGLAQADVFGILARERVNLAFIWHTPEGTQNLAWQLFRNYDGDGNRFGDQFLLSTSPHPDLTIHAAKRGDGATTIAVINKNLGGPCELKLDAPGLKGKLRVWRFDQSRNRVVEVAVESTNVNGVISLTLPAASASMLIVK